MQIVVTACLDEARALVEESTRLVDLYQDKHPDFPERLVGWLRRAEETLKQHRRSQLGPMSALRARALAAIAGVPQYGPSVIGNTHHNTSPMLSSYSSIGRARISIPRIHSRLKLCLVFQALVDDPL